MTFPSRTSMLIGAAVFAVSIVLLLVTGQSPATCRFGDTIQAGNWACKTFWLANLAQAMSLYAMLVSGVFPWVASRLKARREQLRALQERDKP
jgi:hypothetical protein